VKEGRCPQSGRSSSGSVQERVGSFIRWLEIIMLRSTRTKIFYLFVQPVAMLVQQVPRQGGMALNHPSFRNHLAYGT